MSVKRQKTNDPPTISYGGVTLRLEVIAGFYPHVTTNRNTSNCYGITFLLRTGGTVQAEGDSELYRNRVLKYLKRRLHTLQFQAIRCKSGCANFQQAKGSDNPDDCEHNAGHRSCYSYNGYPNYKAKSEEECTTIWLPSELHKADTQ